MYQGQSEDPYKRQNTVDPQVMRDLTQAGQQVAEHDQFSQMCVAKRYIAEDHVKRYKMGFAVRVVGRIACIFMGGVLVGAIIRGFK